MILKRVGAVALAVILIGGAWLVRDQVIEDNGGSGDDDPPRTGITIVCIEELRDACNTLGLDIQIEDAATTIDALAALQDPSEAPIWITVEPFPAMVDSLRVNRGAPELATDQSVVASSPITLVVPPDRAAVLTAACETPLDWACIGTAAGNSWADIGGNESWGDVRPAFAPIDSAIGLLGVGQAVSGYFDGPIQPSDPDFVTWARRLSRAVSGSALTGRTAIETIETRPSALDVAVGADAEFTGTGASELSLQYAEPMIRADVVVAVPGDASMPSGLADDLTRLLVTEGRWAASSTEPNPLPSAVELLAIRTAWEDIT